MPDLLDLPDGTSVFVDTNIFHFHFQKKSKTCTDFLERIAHGDVETYVNTQVLSDLLHKLMMSEAINKNCMSGTNPQGLKKYLKGSRGKTLLIGDYEQQFAAILSIGIHVLPITELLLTETKVERKKYCLMTGDSVHLGTMNRRRVNRRKAPLQNIVTYDGDFAHIPGITVWVPMDISKNTYNAKGAS